jgi:hypothetical protein
MRAPLLRRGAVVGSYLKVLGVDAEDRDPDLVADPEDAEPEEPDAIRRGIQELPQWWESVGCGAGGISRMGSFPRSMCSRTNSSVRSGALHQRRRPAALLRAEGGGGWRMWLARHSRPRYIGALVLTRLAAWLAVHRRQPLQRAEDDACG